MTDLPPLPLPSGVRSRVLTGVNGLDVHVLEAGFDEPQRPCVLLLHGFPELAFSWRKLLLPLAELGYYVVAPDLRGYGRTLGWDANYDGDLASFHMPNLVLDVLTLVQALGHARVHAVVGHDFGSPLAAWCALIRPDVFNAVALMSAPFAGPPPLPARTTTAAAYDIHAALAALPQPRKHYQAYYGTRSANADMLGSAQGMQQFLRAYYHCKSADWVGNQPQALAAWSALELARLPNYYVMQLGDDMPTTVAAMAPSAAAAAACTWLTDTELQVYCGEFARTGFQGGLQWYRAAAEPLLRRSLPLFARRTIDVPACFIAGANDWGIQQTPGALIAMRERACTRLRFVRLIDRAGHWVQQEQAAEVTSALGAFLAELLPP